MQEIKEYYQTKLLSTLDISKIFTNMNIDAQYILRKKKIIKSIGKKPCYYDYDTCVYLGFIDSMRYYLTAQRVNEYITQVFTFDYFKKNINYYLLVFNRINHFYLGKMIEENIVDSNFLKILEYLPEDTSIELIEEPDLYMLINNLVNQQLPLYEYTHMIFLQVIKNQINYYIDNDLFFDFD